MKHLWAPWRMDYVSTADNQTGCVFCACAHDPAADEARGVLARAHRNFLILNAFPYNSGHLMIVPYEHHGDFVSLAAETLQEMMRLAQIALRVLQQELRCEGANIGLNIGKPAGAGIKDHLHLHIVPRWTGDTNYMTTLGETRVVPQSLHATWTQLAPPMRQALADAGLLAETAGNI